MFSFSQKQPSKKTMMETLMESMMMNEHKDFVVAVAVIMVTTLCLVTAFRRYYLYAQLKCFALQFKYLFTGLGLHWFETQYQIYCLLCIEAAHLEDVAENGLPRKLVSTGLRHVNTASSATSFFRKIFSCFGKSKKISTMGGDGTGPFMKDLVLIGGGHTHAFVLKMWGMNPMPGVRLTLVTPSHETPYSGMLPAYCAGMYTREECHIDLARLASFANANVVYAAATGIDRKQKLVRLSGNHPPVHYDVLSINVGSTPQAVESSDESVPETPVKPISSFSARWNTILNRVLTSKNPFRIVTVGAGAGGVELTLCMQRRIENEIKKSGKGDPKRVSFTILSRRNCVCPAHSKGVQSVLLRILKSRGVDVRLETEARGVKAKQLMIKTKDKMNSIPCDEVIWCTNANAAKWFRETDGLNLDNRGFVSVRTTLQSTNDPHIFAAGDCCAIKNHPRAKAGVFAVRAGPPLNRNLRRVLSGENELEQWIPQRTFLGLIGTGDPKVCVASSGNMVIEGAWLWDLKDWIDRKWMAGYTHMLPEIAARMMKEMEENLVHDVARNTKSQDALDVLKHASMRCGGCGAKVGATVLSRVMKRLNVPTRDEVLVGLDAPDDAAVVRALPPRMAAVHTVDFFRSIGVDPFMFGRIAAVHSLSDSHAMGARPITALAIAVVPYGVESVVEETLFQMMSGAVDALREVNCALIGGHTCEGKELSLGFAVNGAVQMDKVLQKGGMCPGEKIILTKPIGTGTLFAAHMRVQAEGKWIAKALKHMAQSNYRASECFNEFDASACTDVTGFGVLGHLSEMVKASDVGAKLNLDALPLMDGALECVVKKKIFSSLQPANLRLRRAISNEASALKHPVYPLIFDPQTSGGLLATVSAKNADECVSTLRKIGYEHACIIGEVVQSKGVHCFSGSNGE